MLSALSGAGWGQETRGSIEGRVLDSTQAAVPGAKVTATNKGTNVGITATSNETGNYTIPFLNPGMYLLTAESAGFKTFVRDNIEIRVHDRLQVDVALELGDVTERIEVTSQTPLLETINANRGQVIDRRRVSELPIPHGSFASLVWLASNQVHGTAWNDFRENQPTQIWALSDVSVEGGVIGSGDWTMDGVPNTQTSNSPGGRGVANSPPADLIQEFKMETDYDAGVGHTSGSVISVSLKTGTNDLHGTGYGFWRNSFLNANGYTPNLTGETKRTFVYGRWGTTATGPVRIPKIYNGKDRTFFSYGYEGLHQSLPEQYLGTVPTAAQRQGDFSELLKLGSAYQIYDPLTTRAAAGGRFARDPFVGNLIPASRQNAIAQKYLSFVPPPNATGTPRGESNYVQGQSPDWQQFYNHLVRVDHTISSRNRIYVRGAVSRKLDGPYFVYFGTLTSGGNYIGKNRNFVFDEVYTPTPSMVVNARYGYARYAGGESPNSFDLAQLGFSSRLLSLLDPRAQWFPSFSVAGYTMPSKSGLSVLNNDIHSLALDVSVYRGSHSLKFGADLRADRNAYGSYSGIVPNFSFDSSYTNGPLDSAAAAPIGQGLAALLLGIPSSGSITRVDSQAIQSPYYGFYAQNDWRVSRKLTINLGLRWEYEGPLTERYNRSVRSFDATVANPVEAAAKAAYAANPIPEIPASAFSAKGGRLFAGRDGAPRNLWDPDWNNFAPRIGFAYQAAKNTAVRGGYGIYYVPVGQAANTTAIQSGYSQATNLIPSLDNGLTFIADLNNPFPNGVLTPTGSSLGLSTDVGRSISAFNPRLRSPYAQRWSLGFQHLLPGNFLFDAGYVGNRGTKLRISQDFDTLPAQYLSKSPFRDQATINFLSAAVPNPFAGLLSGTSLNGGTVARSQLLRPFPEFAGVTIPTNQGYSWYHSLQMRAERRFATGFSLLTSYTFSKTMQATERLNAADPAPTKAISSMDRTHSLSVSGIAELPFGDHRRFLSSGFPVLRQIVTGWQTGVIFLAMSGTPLGFGNAIFTGNIKDIALPESQRTYYRAFNIDAGFERDPSKQLASNLRTFPLRFSGVRSDGYTTWDISLIKETAITEHKRIQLRAEFLNAFNHPNFRLPNTTPSSSAFGSVSGENSFAREIQLALKFLF